MRNVVDDFVEVTLPTADAFLKVKETLTRIGIQSRNDKTLYQTCHILHKRGKYYIVHFKELFKLDGKSDTFDNDDLGRRNTIVNLLEEWSLINVVDHSKVEDPIAPLSTIKIVTHADKSNWKLVSKYTVGKKRY